MCVHTHNKTLTHKGVVSNEVLKPFPADEGVAVGGRVTPDLFSTMGRMVTPTHRGVRYHEDLTSLWDEGVRWVWSGIYIKVMMHDDMAGEFERKRVDYMHRLISSVYLHTGITTLLNVCTFMSL